MAVEALAIGGALAVATAGSVFVRAVFMPRSQICGPVIWRGSMDAPPRLALTFDDGPHPKATPRILDILRGHEAPAAFFVIGLNAERWPDLLRRMRDEGHLIGNHSFTHAHMGSMRRDRYWADELERCDAAIEAALGTRPALFRPPMGFKTFHIARQAQQRGQTMVTWTRRALDGFHTTPQRLIARLGDSASAGDIIALHDGLDPSSRRTRNLDATIEALPRLIERWRARGLTVAHLDQLIGVAPYRKEQRDQDAARRVPSHR